MPPVFGWLAKTGGVRRAEMLRTFNCGIGMIAVVEAEAGGRGCEAFAAAGELAVRHRRAVVARTGDAGHLHGALAL